MGSRWFQKLTDGKVVTPCSTCRRGIPFDPRCVAPQIFEAVESAFVPVKNVNNHLQVIEHHPLAGRKSVNGYRPYRVVFSQPGLDFACDRFELWLRRARADDEEIRKARDVAQIKQNNVLGLFVRGKFGAGFC